MHEHQFDRVARLLSSAGSRRQALAALGALALARAHPASAASQIETAACGEAGAVCTQIKGCCSGLVCATSYANPAYGVCVTGEGDMLPVSDDIVVPGSEGVEDELAQEVTDAAAAATEAESALAAQDAAIQSRKDARDTRESTRRTRLQTNRNTQQTRKATNRSTRRSTRRSTKAANQAARDLNRKPRLTLTFLEDANPNKTGQQETLRVSNDGNDWVVLSYIESIKAPDVFKELFVSIPPGGVHRLKSGDPDDASSSTSGVTVWTTKTICPNGEGVNLTAVKSGSTKTRRFPVLCGETVSTVSTTAVASQSGKKNEKKRRA